MYGVRGCEIAELLVTEFFFQVCAWWLGVYLSNVNIRYAYAASTQSPDIFLIIIIAYVNRMK